MKNFLLIIDPQRDFHGGGSLSIPGADSDSARIADMIMKNVEVISEVFITLDSHHKHHISHAAFWTGTKNESDDKSTGQPPDFCQITSEDIVNRRYHPVDEKLMDYCLEYTRSLESKNRFTHTIYPEHCLIGSAGHAVVENIHLSIQHWSSVHRRNITYVHKGQNCLTEMYSAVEAEVPVSSDPATGTNMELLQKLKQADTLVICGQALSHCVQYTVRDIIKHWTDDKKKIVLLLDGSSPVNTPESKLSAEKFVHEMRSVITVCNTCDAFHSST